MFVAVGRGGVLMTAGAAVRAFAGHDYGVALAGTVAIAPGAAATLAPTRCRRSS